MSTVPFALIFHISVSSVAEVKCEQGAFRKRPKEAFACAEENEVSSKRSSLCFFPSTSDCCVHFLPFFSITPDLQILSSYAIARAGRFRTGAENIGGGDSSQVVL